MSKSFDISKSEVWEAWKTVKANAGSGGIDGQSVADFEKDVRDNLYKIWNRMSSGSYISEAVRGVEIPKKNGGVRLLGIPTVTERVAQSVVAGRLEARLEAYFHPDSYGYRPHKSAHDAISVTRQRCWKMDWIVEFDIVGLFDNIPTALLLRALKHHDIEEWVILYVERWLKAPTKRPNGDLCERTSGVPQGGVVSPILSNLFMHYAFDTWMTRRFPGNPWCRYADDGLVHCRSFEEAQQVLKVLGARFKECGLELHPVKTQIVYCADGKRRQKFPSRKFSFLGYEFRGRLVRNSKTGEIFQSFTPAICPKAQKSIREQVRVGFESLGTHVKLSDVAKELNPKVRGWLSYYGKFNRGALSTLSFYINQKLMVWARHKYGSLFRRRWGCWHWLHNRFRENPRQFFHWGIFKVCSMGAV